MSVHRVGAWLEISLFVKHGIVRQQSLAVDADDVAVPAQRNGVVQRAVFFVDEADNCNAIIRDSGNALDGESVVAHERFLQQKIFGRISGDRQLWIHNDVTPLGFGTRVIGEGQLFIASQVTHRGV